MLRCGVKGTLKHVLGRRCPWPRVEGLLALAWSSGAKSSVCTCPCTWTWLHLDSGCGDSAGMTKGNAPVVRMIPRPCPPLGCSWTFPETGELGCPRAPRAALPCPCGAVCCHTQVGNMLFSLGLAGPEAWVQQRGTVPSLSPAGPASLAPGAWSGDASIPYPALVVLTAQPGFRTSSPPSCCLLVPAVLSGSPRYTHDFPPLH